MKRQNVVCTHCQYLRERVVMRSHGFEWGAGFYPEPESSCSCYEIEVGSSPVVTVKAAYHEGLIVAGWSAFALAGALWVAGLL